MSQLGSNPYLLNIVPLFNLGDPNNGTIASDLTAAVSNITNIVNPTTQTIYVNRIEPYTTGSGVEMIGDFNVLGALTINGFPIGADDTGSNFISGSNFVVSTGTTGFAVNTSNASTSNNVIQFITSGNSVFEIDSIGRALYKGDGTSSNINRLWISSAIHHADRTAVNLGGSNTMSTIFDVWNGDAYFDQSIYVNQDVFCQTLHQASDERFKTCIGPIKNGLSTIKMIQGVHYTMSGKPTYGFIAQSLEKVIPEAVATAPSGVMAVDYTKVIPFLVEAVKELTDAVKELAEKR
jgi:hypothetical protein